MRYSGSSPYATTMRAIYSSEGIACPCGPHGLPDQSLRLKHSTPKRRARSLREMVDTRLTTGSVSSSGYRWPSASRDREWSTSSNAPPCNVRACFINRFPFSVYKPCPHPLTTSIFLNLQQTLSDSQQNFTFSSSSAFSHPSFHTSMSSAGGSVSA